MGSYNHIHAHAYEVSRIPEEGAVEVEISRTEVAVDPERIAVAM
jgi:hypothetical protein